MTDTLIRINPERLARRYDQIRSETSDMRLKLEELVEEYPGELELIQDVQRRLAAISADLCDRCIEIAPSLPLHDEYGALSEIEGELV